MIRPATLHDSPRIVELMEQAFARSRYRHKPGAAVDRTYALQFLKGVMMRNGFKSAEGTWCSVYVEKDQILGYHLGMEQRIMQVGTLYEAVGIHFYVDPNASPFAAVSLLKSFASWAAGRPRILEFCLDANDLMGDFGAMAETYQKVGFFPCAMTLRQEFDRQKTVKEVA